MLNSEINIVLIDSHPLFREGIKRVLAAESMFNVIAVGDRNVSISDLVQKKEVDILIIDATILKENNIQIKEDILIFSPETKVIVLGRNDEGSSVINALNSGAHGFLLKEMDVKSFVESIKAIFQGRYYVHSKATHYLIKAYLDMVQKNGIKADNSRQKVQPPLHLYTKRECEILQLLANGYSNRTIAEKLAISEKTVKNHISSLFKKMNVNDRTQAVVAAIRNEWVEI